MKKSTMSALKLAIIITGSIVAAAGIVFAIMKVMKKYRLTKKAEPCEDALEEDIWDFDDDILDDLDDFDDFDEDCILESEPKKEDEE